MKRAGAHFLQFLDRRFTEDRYLAPCSFWPQPAFLLQPVRPPMTLRFQTSIALAVLLLYTVAARAQNPGIGSVTVHTALGGQIFGFDVDANGTEGLLTEAQTLSNGNTLNAVETFDQATGKILQIVKQSSTKDEDVTLGVVS